MVEHMVKLTLLFRPASRDTFLTELQKFGIVHVEQREVDEDSETSRLATRIARVVGHRQFLRDRAAELPNAPEEASYDGNIDELIRKVDLLRVRIDGYETEGSQLLRELNVAERWGNFDREKIEGLESHGLRMTVHSAPRATADEIAARLEGDSERSFVRLFEDGTRIFFAVVAPSDEEESPISVAEERLPERSESEVRERLEKVERGLEEAFTEVDELLPYREELSGRIMEMENELSYKLVRASVRDASDGHLFFLTGWIPVNERGRVEEFLQREEAVYILERPTVEDRVPVKLHNDGYTRLFEPILRIFSIPNYQELDPTPFFAPFYTIFFGLCVADLGYGLLLLVVALAAFILIRRKSIRPLLRLGVVLASSVAVFGFLLNDFFGLKITKLFGPDSSLAHAVAFSSINSAMLLAITLGIVQISFAYVLRAVNSARHEGPAGAFKPVGIALMLLGVVIAALTGLGSSFKVGPIPFGALIAAIPHAKAVGLGMVVVGLLFLLFFNSLEKKIFLRPLLGLWELYELLTTVPGYVLSYLRLFALGLSGALLGETTINLAMMVKGPGHSAVGVVLMVLVLLIGSGVNLAIGLLSAFVHSLRLTFVEFYNSLGFKGGGVKYRPFEVKS